MIDGINVFGNGIGIRNTSTNHEIKDTLGNGVPTEASQPLSKFAKGSKYTDEATGRIWQRLATSGLDSDWVIIPSEIPISVSPEDLNNEIVSLKGGVTVAGNTLKKLYDLIIGVGTLVGDFNASSGSLPTTGSGNSGVIDKNDMWRITTAGTLPVGLTPVRDVIPGDVLVARINNASTGADFYVIQNTVELATSTVLGLMKLYTDLSGVNTDGSVTQAAIAAALSGKQNTLVSGTTINTINGVSLLGGTNLVFTGETLGATLLLYGGFNNDVVYNTDVGSLPEFLTDTDGDLYYY